MVNIITYCYYITVVKLLFQIVKKTAWSGGGREGVEIHRKRSSGFD